MSEAQPAGPRRDGHVERWFPRAILCFTVRGGEGSLALVPSDRDAPPGCTLHDRARAVKSPLDARDLRPLAAALIELADHLESGSGDLFIVVAPDGSRSRTGR